MRETQRHRGSQTVYGISGEGGTYEDTECEAVVGEIWLEWGICCFDGVFLELFSLDDFSVADIGCADNCPGD